MNLLSGRKNTNTLNNFSMRCDWNAVRVRVEFFSLSCSFYLWQKKIMDINASHRIIRWDKFELEFESAQRQVVDYFVGTMSYSHFLFQSPLLSICLFPNLSNSLFLSLSLSRSQFHLLTSSLYLTLSNIEPFLFILHKTKMKRMKKKRIFQ